MVKTYLQTLTVAILLSFIYSFTLQNNVSNNTGSEKIFTDTIKIRKSPSPFKIKRCVIWVPTDYCTFPKSASFATTLDRDGVELDYIDCKVANETENISCIWLSILGTEKSNLTVEDHLKNFTLIKGKNKIEHPFMIKVSDEPKLWSANLKGKKITVHYSKQIDVFLYFKNVNAKVGQLFSINSITTTITS
jgi:hypothetical protein